MVRLISAVEQRKIAEAIHNEETKMFEVVRQFAISHRLSYERKGRQYYQITRLEMDGFKRVLLFKITWTAIRGIEITYLYEKDKDLAGELAKALAVLEK